MRKDARSLAFLILCKFEKKPTRIDHIIYDAFGQYDVNIKYRPRTKVIVNEIVRLKSRLDTMIEYVSGRFKKNIEKKILNILRIGFYEIIIDDKVPDYAAVNSAVDIANYHLNKKGKGFVNAILRKMVLIKNDDCNWYIALEKKSTWNSFPLWLQKRWRENIGEERYIKMLDYFNLPPTNYIRIDYPGETIEEVRKILLKDSINSKIFSPSFLEISKGFTKLLKSELFLNGNISIQNPASAAVVDCLGVGTGDTVLDVCAAPGTKSLYLSSLVGENGQILASDINERRIEKSRNDIKRHGKSNIIWELKDATKATYEMSDFILIDAPCTGTGVIGRKPDIRWIREPDDIKKMSRLQLDILNNCSKFVRPNGTLVYATCSLEPEENWEVVEEFLKLNTEYSIDIIPSKIPKSWIDDRGALSTMPFIHGVDGMFATKMVRS